MGHREDVAEVKIVRKYDETMLSRKPMISESRALRSPASDP